MLFQYLCNTPQSSAIWDTMYECNNHSALAVAVIYIIDRIDTKKLSKQSEHLQLKQEALGSIPSSYPGFFFQLMYR